MHKLYLFNPDNDLALANNDENYMSPKSAQLLETDLALLPIWYADPDSYVLGKSHPNASYLEKMKSIFPITSSLITFPEVEKLSDFKLSPWGWNKALLKRMRLLGCKDEALLSDSEVDNIRTLTHRSTGVKLLQAIPKSTQLCGFSFVLSHLDDLKSIASKLGHILLKAPYSGSGKGLKWSKGAVDVATLNWCSRVIDNQESVIVEPVYNKVSDFAMEFYISAEHTIHFVGYSSFNTSINGAYIGNNLLSDDLFEDELNYKYFEHQFMQRTRHVLAPLLLNTVSPHYTGPLGVDMMVCKFEDEPIFRLHPCVEINLRMNMGLVSHAFYSRYVSPNRKGSYQIDFSKKTSTLMNKHAEFEKKYPLVVKNGVIESGYLALSALSRESQYLAWTLIE